VLYLLVQVQAQRYAVATTHVLEVLPMLEWRPVARAAPANVGLLHYHARSVPLVDLSIVLGGTPTPTSLSSRIIIAADARDEGCLLGLLVEGVTGTLRRTPSEIADPRHAAPDVPYLGEILTDGAEMIHCLEIAPLLAAYVGAGAVTS
jgi:chemotaxis-related protein WspB